MILKLFSNLSDCKILWFYCYKIPFLIEHLFLSLTAHLPYRRRFAEICQCFLYAHSFGFNVPPGCKSEISETEKFPYHKLPSKLLSLDLNNSGPKYLLLKSHKNKCFFCEAGYHGCTHRKHQGSVSYTTVFFIQSLHMNWISSSTPLAGKVYSFDIQR